MDLTTEARKVKGLCLCADQGCSKLAGKRGARERERDRKRQFGVGPSLLRGRNIRTKMGHIRWGDYFYFIYESQNFVIEVFQPFSSLFIYWHTCHSFAYKVHVCHCVVCAICHMLHLSVGLIVQAPPPPPPPPRVSCDSIKYGCRHDSLQQIMCCLITFHMSKRQRSK